MGLKGFSEAYYRRIIGGELRYVLRTLKILSQEKKWSEIVTLLVPTLNDGESEIRRLSTWVRDNLGEDTPLHFIRFVPQYRLRNLPPTPVRTLERARDVARDVGLDHVYIGNLPGHSAGNTLCPRCGRLLVQRIGFKILKNRLRSGRCSYCGNLIVGIYS